MLTSKNVKNDFSSMTILLRGCNLYQRRIWSKITVVFINVSVRWFSRLREQFWQGDCMYKFLSCKNPKRVTHKFLACTRGHYTHTVPFKSKLTLDFRSSRESRIENRIENRESSRESRLDSRLLRLDSRFSTPAWLIKPERPLFSFE